MSTILEAGQSLFDVSNYQDFDINNMITNVMIRHTVDFDTDLAGLNLDLQLDKTIPFISSLVANKKLLNTGDRFSEFYDWETGSYSDGYTDGYEIKN
jgi:hypothetical protein